MVTDSEIQLALACGDIPQTDLAYIAGLFDGEGSIYLSARYGRCRVEWQITSCDRALLEWVQLKVGGHLYPRHIITHSSQIAFYQQSYDLSITKSLHLKFLINALLPYLKTKKLRMEYALQIISGDRDRVNQPRSKQYWKRLIDLVNEANQNAPPGRPQYGLIKTD